MECHFEHCSDPRWEIYFKIFGSPINKALGTPLIGNEYQQYHPETDGKEVREPISDVEAMLTVPVYSTLEKVGINTYHWLNFCITTVTIPALRLLRLRHCMGASVDHLSAGLKKSLCRQRRKTFLSSSSSENKVMLESIAMERGDIVFGKTGKMNPTKIGHFKSIAKVGTVAYRLELPEQLSRVHSKFHVSKLKNCMAEEPLAIPLDEIQVDDKMLFQSK
ncbi:hypothetical protein Tco_0317927 [Tanacetum coccineum]